MSKGFYDIIYIERKGGENMNIYAIEGHKVTVTGESVRNGYKIDQDMIREYGIEVGKEYTVAYTEVGGSHTDVVLQEFPEARFNSVNFVDVKPQSKEDDMQHEDWKRYNY